jgi:hypothetical protein
MKFAQDLAQAGRLVNGIQEASKLFKLSMRFVKEGRK